MNKALAILFILTAAAFFIGAAHVQNPAAGIAFAFCCGLFITLGVLTFATNPINNNDK